MLKIINKPKSPEYNHYLFLYFCKYSATSVIDHLLTVQKVYVYETTVHQAFRECCLQGRLKVVQWLHEHFMVEFSKEIRPELLTSLCEKGHVSVLMWIFTHFHVDVQSLEPLLLLACTHGHVELAKYILTKLVATQNINPHTYIEKTVSQEAFQQLCESGSLPIVKWLYSMHYGYLYWNKSKGIELLCNVYRKGDKPMMDWLLSVFVNDFERIAMK
jgi:uncharacterized protein YbgA (DUF1722 family)